MTNFYKLLITLAFLNTVSWINAQTFTDDFSTGYEGWSADFADYPKTDSVFYELKWNRTTLPSPLNINTYALMISGNNHSDDLFMFIKRKVTGLQPNTKYKLLIDVEFASNVFTNGFGVGGAPAESVTVKAGASIIEPKKVETEGFYQMNIDKNNQVNSGTDMYAIGHVGVSDTTTVYTLVSRTNADQLFDIKTDANGEVWVIIGTDSGFEATTTLYYNSIKLKFTTDAAGIDFKLSETMSVYPNPAQDIINIEVDRTTIGQAYRIIDLTGKQIAVGLLTSKVSTIDISTLANGIYLLDIGEQDYSVLKLVKN